MTPQQMKTYRGVWAQVCLAQGWAELPVKERDEKRMAIHQHMLKARKSSKDFTNDDLDRVHAMFAVLIHPDDLNARMLFDAYERGEDPGQRKRLVYAIGAALNKIEPATPERYLAALLRDLFDRTSLDALTEAQLTHLRNLLNDRARSRDRKAKLQPSNQGEVMPDGSNLYRRSSANDAREFDPHGQAAPTVPDDNCPY